MKHLKLFEDFLDIFKDKGFINFDDLDDSNSEDSQHKTTQLTKTDVNYFTNCFNKLKQKYTDVRFILPMPDPYRFEAHYISSFKIEVLLIIGDKGYNYEFCIYGCIIGYTVQRRLISIKNKKGRKLKSQKDLAFYLCYDPEDVISLIIDLLEKNNIKPI